VAPAGHVHGPDCDHGHDQKAPEAAPKKKVAKKVEDEAEEKPKKSAKAKEVEVEDKPKAKKTTPAKK